MRRLGLAGALTLGALALPLQAAADHKYDRRGDAYEAAHRAGYKNGLKEGLREGRRDAERRRGFELRREGRYRDGDHGYRSHYGPRREYVHGFRRGYEEGYTEGYESRAYRYGRRRGYDDRRYRYPDDRRYGSRDDRYDDSYDAYDYQRDGRHRHRGRSGWCHGDH